MMVRILFFLLFLRSQPNRQRQRSAQTHHSEAFSHRFLDRFLSRCMPAVKVAVCFNSRVSEAPRCIREFQLSPCSLMRKAGRKSIIARSFFPQAETERGRGVAGNAVY